jgi:N-acetylmuramic acid 6-phosphate etherase
MGTETASRRFKGIDAWEDAEILDALLESQLAAVAAVRPALPALAASAADAAPRLRRGGRLVYAGAGTSGRVAAQDGSELFPTFGHPQDKLAYLIAGGATALSRPVENAEDDAEAGRDEAAALRLGPDDVVIGVAASGGTPYTRAVLQEAARAGALTIAVASNPGAPIFGDAAHAVLLATGEEPIAGSTRLKAGTAQKVALNLFSTLVMTRLGHVYDGLMVDMQPTNAKLNVRSVRMLRSIVPVDEATARSALEAAGQNVKLAALVALGDSAEEGRRRLDAADGDLRRAMAAKQDS